MSGYGSQSYGGGSGGGGYGGGGYNSGYGMQMPRMMQSRPMSMGADNFGSPPQVPSYNAPQMSVGGDNFGSNQPPSDANGIGTSGPPPQAPQFDAQQAAQSQLQNVGGFNIAMNRITPQQAGPAYGGGGSNWQDRPFGPMRQGPAIPSGWNADPNANGNPFWQSILNSRGPWTYNRG